MKLVKDDCNGFFLDGSDGIDTDEVMSIKIGGDAQQAIDSLMRIVNELEEIADLKQTAVDLTTYDIGNTYRITGGYNDGKTGQLITVDSKDTEEMKCEFLIGTRNRQWIENWARIERVKA